MDSYSSWQIHQDEAKKLFRNGNFDEAFSSFREALILFTRTTSEAESQQQQHRQQRSILLSNMVACRLKMERAAENLSAALEEARECVLWHDKWPKGYVRLAAVYMALGNHSNDACQALQTALRLDPSNAFARSMLLGELRRNSGVTNRENNDVGRDQTEERRRVGGVGTNGSGTNPGQSCCEYKEYDDVDDVCYAFTHSSGNSGGDSNSSRNSMSRTRNFFSMSWVYSFASWYNNCTENAKQRLQILALLTILYVSFGGRFGLKYIMALIRSSTSSSSSSTTSPHLGNYGEDNAYERFYKEKSAYLSHDNNVGKNNRFSNNDFLYQYGQHEYYHQYDNVADFHSLFLFTMILTTVILILTLAQHQVLRRGVPVAVQVPPGIGLGFGRHGRWMGRGGGGAGVGHVYIGGFHIPLNLGRMNHFRGATR